MIMRERKIGATLGRLKALISEDICDIKNLEYCECGYKKGNLPQEDAKWDKVESSTRLMAEDRHYWIRGHFCTPDVDEDEEIYLTMKSSMEIGWFACCKSSSPQCIVYLNGKMVQEFDGNHRDVLLEKNKEYDVYIYFYSGLLKDEHEIGLYLTKTNKLTEKLYYDISVPYEGCLLLDKKSQDYADILKHLDYAVNIIFFYDEKSDEFKNSIKDAIKYLDENFYHGVCCDKNGKLYCVGQTHIDVAWLWDLAQTREKVQRSFSTVLNLMKRYPEYMFMCSQPQLYVYLKEEAPDIYEQIKQRVKEGRWEIDGAMWLEADCNLTCGESIIRQIIYGKKFMKDEFNVESKYLWLPDSFGFSASLPQILKKCGIEKFVTSKISWNEFNKVPYDTFMWEGIDSSRIFTHFFTLFNADITAEFIKTRVIDDNIQKLYTADSMLCYGWGDGGGGPTSEMLERQRRFSYGIPGMPQTKMSRVDDFLDMLEDEFMQSCNRLNKTPSWVGDLYLELHRGTYTTMSVIKKKNRKSEILYINAEGASVLDMLLNNNQYPSEKIEQGWKIILLNQFHDIIPGSSIKKVYEDSLKQYDEVFLKGNMILNTALNNIAKNIQTDGGIFAYNPNGFNYSGVVKFDGDVFYVDDIPPIGYNVMQLSERINVITFEDKIIETPFYIVKFNDLYNIVSLFDKENNYEVVQSGEEFNELRIFEDMPYDNDAWDISEYYKDKYISVSNIISVKTKKYTESFEIEITRNIFSSKIVQTLCFYNHIRRIDVRNYIDWKEKKLLLKTFFPVNVHAREATYDIQFGNIKHATHDNTSWDRARFEVCAHKWADVSEFDYGVSILNDCKYGYNCDLNNLSLSLIKCPTYPNPDADKCEHEFTYSIFPHKGSWENAATAKEAYMLNNPPTLFKVEKHDGVLKDTFSFIDCKEENIMVESIKLAENKKGIIIRLYEYFNKHTKIHLKTEFKFSKVYLCDMTENNLEELYIDDAISFDIKPYEIITLRLVI